MELVPLDVQIGVAVAATVALYAMALLKARWREPRGRRDEDGGWERGRSPPGNGGRVPERGAR